jgi:prolyl 4-hydroxylase
MGKNKTEKHKPKGVSSSKAGGGGLPLVYIGAALCIAVAAVGLQKVGLVPALPWLSSDQSLPEAPPVKATKARGSQSASTMTPPPRKRPPPAAQEDADVDLTCVDSDESCDQWAKSGECDRNPAFMHRQCRAACHICKSGKPKPKRVGACEDSNANCATWAAIGECQSNPGYMLQQCPVTCKMCQSESCRDELDDCAARCRGPAESNFSESLRCYYEPELVEKCAWTCGACKEHRFSKPQCARPGVPAAAVPGSVNEIFQSIVDTRDDVSILSGPSTGGPWVLTLDSFMTSEEADEVLKAGSVSGTAFARSQAGDGVQAARTSSTAWCKGKCLQNPTVRAIEERVSTLMGGIPMENAEPMQVLRYDEGQFYKVHHDQNSPRSSAWGPRMFTMFMYIGDGYSGGETHFPRLNLTIPPGKGRACVWTSVLDSDPYQRDDRTDHESLPVTSGVKYGVNYWIHMYPFRKKSELGCGNEAYTQNWY